MIKMIFCQQVIILQPFGAMTYCQLAISSTNKRVFSEEKGARELYWLG